MDLAQDCMLFEGNDPDREKKLTYAETLDEVCRTVSEALGACK